MLLLLLKSDKGFRKFALAAKGYSGPVSLDTRTRRRSGVEVRIGTRGNERWRVGSCARCSDHFRFTDAPDSFRGSNPFKAAVAVTVRLLGRSRLMTSVPWSTHAVELRSDRVIKRFKRESRGECKREWRALTLLAAHAPGLAPVPQSADLVS